MSPDPGLALGIDVSHYRGQIDWQLVVNDGVHFSITKATDGGYFVDPTFDYNWTQMRRVGLIRGAYHFFRPAVDPEEQAELFLSIVGNILHETDLPAILDVEAYPSYVRDEYYEFSLAQRQQRVRRWLDVVGAATGRNPIIYTNQSTWQATLGNTQDFKQFPLWVANYGVSKPYVPAGNWGGNGWEMWQYSATGTVQGINDGLPPVDLNVYKSSESAMNNWLGITGPRSLPPNVTNAEMLTAVAAAAQAMNASVQTWITRLDFAYLSTPVSNRARLYDGLAIEEMPLTDQEKAALLDAIEVVQSDPNPNELEGLTNQDMINAFYRAADLLGMPGWTLIQMAELNWLVTNRHAPYTGPSIDELPGLNATQKAALREVLGLTPTDDGGDDDDQDDSGDDEPTEPFPGLTNQMMINAFYEAASTLGLPGWSLITIAELTDLVDERQVIYQGPLIAEMAGLDEDQKEAVARALGLDAPGDDDIIITYPGMVNQDMINVFYRAATQFNQNGWTWIERAQLEYMAATRMDRYEPYRGERVEQLPNLETEEKAALQDELGAFQNF
ncbi:MAG: hypothetical protein DWQ07_04810 [Chloroflexi bacterium]|nr:MAG: hypothetical protein DWQ07_04810 [Chloroflexota bacterium]MBL1194752.1 hypothetical protein [Chloroflexota bacterium]NOH12044.1 hypothetical protein [Chloroflexota bacterium]